MLICGLVKDWREFVDCRWGCYFGWLLVKGSWLLLLESD